MPRSPLLACILLTACLDPVDLGPPDGPISADMPPDAPRIAPAVLSVTATDFDGRPWPLDALPRQPILEVHTSAPVHATDQWLFLFEGALDPEAILDDLRRPPLLVRHQGRTVPVETDGSRLVPERLEPGRSYTLGVAGWARNEDDVPLEAPYVVPLSVATVAAGATVTGSWPADGTAGVPTELPLIALRFDDLVRGEDIAIRSDAGSVRGQLVAIACEEVGWGGGDCRAFIPGGALRPSTEYRIRVGETLLDRSGAPVGPWTAVFHTGDASASPIGFLDTPCQIDEVAAGAGCALADDGSLTFRATVTRPVRAFLSGASVRDRMVANRGEIVLRLEPLVAGSRFDGELMLIGLGGETHVERIPLALPEALLPLTIAEVRANPLGPEPRQEYVEVLNFGATPVSVAGLALADRPDRVGDVISTAQTISPGARALLVADAFDPLDESDPPVPPGVPLVRIGTSLASAGLSNAGEALYLRDAEGRRLAASPALETEGGECLVRRGSVRSGDESAFAIGPCTPGSR